MTTITQRPLVSIIVPSYNAALYLDRTISSVFAQTYREWQLIIVDDQSSDDTQMVLAKYAGSPQVSVMRNAANKGAAASRNRGIEVAHGEIIAFLDADDRWYPNYLETQVSILRTNQEVRCLCSDFNLIDEDDQVTIPSRRAFCWDGTAPLTRHTLSAVWESSEYVIPTAFMLDRAALDAIGRFEEGYAEDINFWLKTAATGFDIYETPAALASYRMHSQQKTKSENKIQIARAEAYRRFVESYPQCLSRIPRESVDQKLFELYTSAGDVHFWIEHDYRRADHYYRLAWPHKPWNKALLVKRAWCRLPEPVRIALRATRSHIRRVSESASSRSSGATRT